MALVSNENVLRNRFFPSAGEEKLLISVCEREIVDVEAKINTALEHLRDVQAESIAEVNAMCQSVRTLQLQLDDQLQRLHSMALKVRDTDTRMSCLSSHRKHKAASERSGRELRHAAGQAMHTLESEQRAQLLSDTRWRPLGQAASHKSASSVARSSGDATERLAHLVAGMNEQVAGSEATLRELTEQSTSLGSTEVEFRSMGATIDSSGKLLTKYSRRAATDRILIALALLFFIGTVLYIVRKRFGFPNVFALFWQ